MQIGFNVTETAAEVPTPQPCLLLHHISGMPKDCFLVFGKKVPCKVEVHKAFFVLFLFFNIHYHNGCSNFYTLLECFFLNHPLTGGKPRVSSVLSQLCQK